MPWTPSSAASVQERRQRRRARSGALGCQPPVVAAGVPTALRASTAPSPPPSGRVVKRLCKRPRPRHPAPTSLPAGGTNGGRHRPLIPTWLSRPSSFAAGTIQPAPRCLRSDSLVVRPPRRNARVARRPGAHRVALACLCAVLPHCRGLEPVTDPAQLNLLEHCRSIACRGRRPPRARLRRGARRCVAGVFQPPVIVLSRRRGLSTAELRSVLIHELAHRGDGTLLTSAGSGACAPLQLVQSAGLGRRGPAYAPGPRGRLRSGGLETLASPGAAWGGRAREDRESVLTRPHATAPRPHRFRSRHGRHR